MAVVKIWPEEQKLGEDKGSMTGKGNWVGQEDDWNRGRKKNRSVCL